MKIDNQNTTYFVENTDTYNDTLFAEPHSNGIGGGGYVGTELQKVLIENQFNVKVFDTFWYSSGKWPSGSFPGQENIEYVTGDVRDIDLLKKTIRGVDGCIHLACISNDPSYELDPNLAREINFEAFKKGELKAL